MANEERDQSPSAECAELIELGDVSEQTKGIFQGIDPELSLLSWRML